MHHDLPLGNPSCVHYKVRTNILPMNTGWCCKAMMGAENKRYPADVGFRFEC
jgi:hypothetical protein